MIAEERERLSAWVDTFERVFGVRPAVTPLPDAPVEAWQLELPRCDYQPQNVIGTVGHFNHRKPQVAGWLKKLGFAWGDDEQLVAVPTPLSFNRLLARTPGAPVFRMQYMPPEPTAPLGRWLSEYCEGRLPLHIWGREHYDRAIAGGSQSTVPLFWQLTSFAHDLSVHALNYHLVPRAQFEELAARIRERLPERFAAWHEPGATAPLTLAFFFDNDFNRYCQLTWNRVFHPAEFAEIFAAPGNFAQLVKALDVRIDETLRGVGDVASGNADDMGALAKVELELERPRP